MFHKFTVLFIVTVNFINYSDISPCSYRITLPFIKRYGNIILFIESGCVNSYILYEKFNILIS